MAGSIARIVTTSAEVKEGYFMTMANAVNGTVLNGILLGQIAYYWQNTKKACAINQTK